MSIVTKTGDRGETSLYDGTRVPKNEIHINLVGELDELNSQLGLLRSFADAVDAQAPILRSLQDDLFELGALIANPKSTGSMTAPLARLETTILELEPTLPPLTQFILPGGHPWAAQAHVARTIARRAERSLVQLSPRPQDALPYLNRLSDYLFLLARDLNRSQGVDDVLWNKS